MTSVLSPYFCHAFCIWLFRRHLSHELCIAPGETKSLLAPSLISQDRSLVFSHLYLPYRRLYSLEFWCLTWKMTNSHSLYPTSVWNGWFFNFCWTHSSLRSDIFRTGNTFINLHKNILHPCNLCPFLILSFILACHILLESILTLI